MCIRDRLYPGAYLCLAPLRDHLKDPKTTCWIAGGALTALCLGCAALCTIFELPSNVFLVPILIISFRLLRWRTEGVTVGQTAFLFSISAVMLAVCSLMAVVLNARAETCLLYTSDAADEEDSVDLGGRRIIKKKNKKENLTMRTCDKVMLLGDRKHIHKRKMEDHRA